MTYDKRKRRLIEDYLRTLDEIREMRRVLQQHQQSLGKLNAHVDDLKEKLSGGVGKNIKSRVYLVEGLAVLIEWHGDDLPISIEVMKPG